VIWYKSVLVEMTVEPIPVGLMGYQPQFDSGSSRQSENKSGMAAAFGQQDAAAGQQDTKHSVVSANEVL
jgi:hypothetical protein